MGNFDWFKKAKYGLFIHFGLYSMLGGEYKGRRSGNYTEWIQSNLRISNKEMVDIAKIFNPIKFNAKEWVSFAKDCGFKYIVFTVKHHDGFALFDSMVSDYNIVNQTNFKRDILKELADECKKQGVKLGIYYSQDLDWHEQDGGGYNTPVVDCAGTAWTNDWDFDNKGKDFNIYFKEKCLPQIKELMTNYGEISIAWFDIPFTLSKYQSEEIYNLVKKYQPNCLINSRLGNGKYDYVSFGDNEIPSSKEELKKINSLDNDINGVKQSQFRLYEVCQTLNQSWGYTKYPIWKDLKLLRNNKEKCEDLKINYLVNIGPDGDGVFPTEAKEILLKLMKNL
jgi:alpha-L-fucosidase